MIRAIDIQSSLSLRDNPLQITGQKGMACLTQTIEPWYFRSSPIQHLWWFASIEHPDTSRVTVDLGLEPLTGELGGVRVHIYSYELDFASSIRLPAEHEQGLPVFDISDWNFEARNWNTYTSDDDVHVKRQKDLMKRKRDDYQVAASWLSSESLIVILGENSNSFAFACDITSQLTLIFDGDQSLAGLIFKGLSDENKEVITWASYKNSAKSTL